MRQFLLYLMMPGSAVVDEASKITVKMFEAINAGHYEG
jgi:hypothetical protein